MLNEINMSFLFFILLFFVSIRYFGFSLLLPTNTFYWFVIALILSIFFNVISVYQTSPYLLNSTISVIPNYLYWTLILLLFNYFIGEDILNIEIIFKYMLYGILFLTIYYYFLQDLFSNRLFFKTILPNNLSFILVTFVPYVCIYLKKKYGILFALLFLLVIVALQLYADRRAGSILISLGGLLTIFADKIFIKKISQFVVFFFLFASFFAVSNTNFFKNQLKNRSERIYNIIYDAESLTTERSSLTRLAMVEKGLKLFDQNKYFGIGFNNFTKINQEIIGDFEGSQYVVDKDIFERTSSHNSYINILSEGGLFFVIPFFMILLSILIRFFRRYFILTIVQLVGIISFFMMLSHLYVINSIINSVCWLNIAFIWYLISIKPLKKKIA